MTTVNIISVRKELKASQLAALLPAAQVATVVSETDETVLLASYAASDLEAAARLTIHNDFLVVVRLTTHFPYLVALRQRAVSQWSHLRILEWPAVTDSTTQQQLATAIMQQLRPPAASISAIDWKRALYHAGASPALYCLMEAEKALITKEKNILFPLLDMARRYLAVIPYQPFLQALLLRFSVQAHDNATAMVNKLAAITLSAEEETIVGVKPFLAVFKARQALQGILH